MTSLETVPETRKMEQQRPPALDGMVDVNKPGDKVGFASPHYQQSGGRPPHAPYSSRQPGYSAHYPGYPGATRPPQLLQSVVTSSFSAGEEDRDPSHRGAYPPVPRHVNICIDQAEQQRWGGPPDERGPSEQRHEAESRDPEHDSGRQQPPAEQAAVTAVGRPATVPQSPARSRFPPLSRGSGSGGSSSMGPPEPMKRSFWHHSRPNEEFTSSLPPEFIPPKRTKVSQGPNLDMRDMRRPPSFFNRELSWDSRGDEGGYYHHGPSRSSPRYSPDQNGNYGYGGPPPPHHQGQHHYHHYSGHGAPGGYRDDEYDHSRARSIPPTPRGGLYPQESGYPSHHHDSPSHAAAAAAAAAQHGRRWAPHDSWQSSPTSGPRRSPTDYHQHHHSMQYRDDVETNRGWSQGRERERHPSHFDGPMDHERAYHNGPSSYHPSSYYGGSMPPLHQKMPPLPHSSPRGGMPMDSAIGPSRSHSMDESARVGPPTNMDGNGKTVTGKDGPLLMLALPQDRISLSETLCVVRENIEVFQATKTDVDAPAPGRKHAVVVGQVGLRCIHCRHTTRTSERVKRAVCYPSSIKRIYRTVIDMKLDHFLQCKFVPVALKDRLAELKVKHTRSTGTTMQYFIRAAHSLGLEDGPSGVRLNNKATHSLSDAGLAGPQASKASASSTLPMLGPPTDKANSEEANYSGPAPPSSSEYRPIPRMDSLTSEASVSTPESSAAEPGKFYTGRINLALQEDKMALSSLRCFLRSQVCAFSATAEDIAVRAPTTFSITVGQVGIGCIHCVNQPSKLRSNRAVCFPFSISRIYQSVADIQRFHFGECKMLPTDVKEKFLTLQKASSKGSKGLATRQYWITSAKKLGLADTPRGIRFARDPSKPEQTAMSLDILAQVAFNVTTASRALVLPEDKPFIAEFLYLVMEQLQPCRFTEADRNKRRLKDVGCIGVECKHCAGQVDGRKFFWSSVNAVESNFVSVHTHMMECRAVPDELKEKLGDLKKMRKEQTAALKTGSQKAFFSRVWSRLHGEKRGDNDDSADNSMTSAGSSPRGSPQMMSSGCPSPMMSGSDAAAVADVSDDMKQMSVVEEEPKENEQPQEIVEI